MPVLTNKKYMVLIMAGFTDSDIEYSYIIPTGIKNTNKEKPTYGGTIAHGAPGILITKTAESNHE